MYKLSVPVNIHTINEYSIRTYIEEFKKAKVDRVFLTGGFSVYKKSWETPETMEKIRNLISFFKSQGIETGVWLSAFGHGEILAYSDSGDYRAHYTEIKGADGKTVAEAFCPLDEKFRADFSEFIRTLASMHPDIIMLDDDFRLNVRSYNMGCCCDLHLKKFYENAGEEIAFEDIERVVFTGGKNKYRSAWLKTMGDSLVDFAKMLRTAVDEVDENVRLGACAVYSTWDFDGTDMITISKAFAGKTKPYIRTIGAPYHGIHPQYAVEHTRMQAAWCKDEDIEIFTEGDVYPRPRYAVPSRLLEIFDLALVSTGETDGILKYMFDYKFDVEYEKGYTSRHIRNEHLRCGIATFFEGKEMVGVKVCEAMHKAENFELPDEYKPGVATFLQNTYLSMAIMLMGDNAIPTVYGKSAGYPSVIFGENARYVNEDDLKNGAILDVVAAKILRDRGIDTGLIDSTPHKFEGEFFPGDHDGYSGLNQVETHKAQLDEKVVADSVFMPDEVPSAYRYENKNGKRFYVLLADMYRSDKTSVNYFLNYYRQKYLISVIEWLCNKPLPAVCTKNPYLYIQTAKGKDGSMSVALFNMNFDEITDAEIVLDKEYTDIRCLNCDGYIDGRSVHLKDEIQPYSAAVFEVR